MPLPTIKPVKFYHKPTLTELGVQALAVIVDESDLENGKIVSSDLSALDSQLGGIIQDLVQLGDFKAEWQQSAVTLAANRAISQRIILIGAGKKTDLPTARARQLGIQAAEATSKFQVNKVAICGSSRFLKQTATAEQLAIGFQTGLYKFPNPGMSDQDRAKLEEAVELTLVAQPSGPAINADTIRTLASAIDCCRLLQDSPANICTPKYVADVVAEKAKKLGVNVQIWGAQKLREMGFNAMMAVAGGSAHEPQFVVLEYKPENFKKTLALVGKGLTMDTGGYSLKPSASMLGMKYDMSGAAVSLSALLAIAELKLPVHVYGIAALCENMVDAHAYRVNDIIKTYSGKTIEILNTDAEGRVVLADALAYTAKDLKPDYIVEFSTLTGAMVVALGHIGAGVFSFPDTEIGNIIQGAAEKTGEKVWLMPTWEEVGEDIKGSIADINNIGATAGSAGSIVGAMFLKEFVGDVPYAHVDIAGVADANQAIGYPRKTGSGWGIQLATEIARDLAN